MPDDFVLSIYSVAAEYQCSGYEFISIGEGRELTRLENMYVRIKYPNVEQWYYNLDEEGDA